MKKFFFQLVLFSFFGGVFGALSLRYVDDSYFASMPETVVATPTVPAAPPLDSWGRIIFENSSTTVNIQVFQGNKVVRQGSGVVVSSDGLVITIADLAVANAVYQIFYEDKVLKGSVVSWDYNRNLLLIKTNFDYPSVIDLSYQSYTNGQVIALIGKLLDLSKPKVYSQQGTISYITDKSVIVDTIVNRNLYGYAIINGEGDFLGLSFLRNGRINLLRAGIIQSFLQEYIAQNKNQ